LCGHGHLDLAAYDAYLSGAMTDKAWDDAELRAAVAKALQKLPAV
jgi:tryptophan synthase beta chain